MPLSIAWPAAVTIELLDGGRTVGSLARFSPNATDLVVLTERDGRPQRSILPAERVACICFHGAGPSVATGEGQKPLRIHIARGRVFRVVARLADVSHPLGFYALASEPAVVYRHVFFYAHGINAREEDVLLGDMLVGAGTVASADLERGLSAQSANRTIPIGRILSEQKQIPQDAIEDAARLQQRKRLRIGEVLIEAGLATADDIERALATPTCSRCSPPPPAAKF